jgi:aryl-alcohol dehydrogenase-like predicted oxidoreductase
VRTVTFGRTGLEITRVGFGAWAIGGSNWEFGWGEQEDEKSVSAIQRALDLGVDWIDTAAQYGLGHSEEVVRRAVEGIQPRPLIFTKGGQPEGPNRTSYQSLKRDSLRRECEGSLERLGVDAIDLYQIHWPIPGEGLVRHIGASNFSVEQLERAEAVALVEALQPPYSLLDREVEADILPYCEEHGIGVIVYSPMASGLLTGRMTRERIESLPADDWRRQSARFREPELSRGLEVVERVKAVAERRGVSPGAVAVAWTLRHPAVHGAIVGFRRPDQVDPIVAAADLDLSDDDVAELED